MLNCVYHPVDDMRVVDNDEREQLLASGFWFDSPVKAKEKRESYEQKLREQPKHSKPKKGKERGNDE